MNDKKFEISEKEKSDANVNANDTQSGEKEDQEAFEELLESLPKEEKHKVIQMMSMQVRGVFSPQNEIMKKFTSDHITEFIETQNKVIDYTFKDNRENRIFSILILIIVAVFILAVIMLLKDKPDIMEKVLYAVGGLIAGIVGGYGYGKTKRDE